MKTTRIISALMLIASFLFIFSACDEDDDDDNNPAPPARYFNATVKYNNTPPESYSSNEYAFDARIYPSGNDTLVFEGERNTDGSYMYFNLITDDVYKFAAGDSIDIPYDVDLETEVFCSILINSVSPEIFQPGGGADMGRVYIDEIDYSAKYLKGRVHGRFFAATDSLIVTDGTFLIDE